MHFRYILAKIQLKNLNNISIGGDPGPLATPLCASFSIQTPYFLLVGAQKYYLPRAQNALFAPLIVVD